MASFFLLMLDTTAPNLGSISLPSNTNSRNVTATLSAIDANFVKLWGDIVSTNGTTYTEQSPLQVAYNTSVNITLTTGDAVKTVYVKFIDDVGNESTTYNASINLDTSAPTVTIIGPDVSKISKVNGYNVSTFTFSSSDSFDEWTIRVVPISDSSHTAGTEIPMTNGSINMNGNTVTAADTAVSCTIYGADLEAASSGDGAKIVKVFVKDLTGNWSN